MFPGARLAQKVKGFIIEENLEIKIPEAAEIVREDGHGRFIHVMGSHEIELAYPDDVLMLMGMLFKWDIQTTMVEEILMKTSNVCMNHAFGCCLMGPDCNYSH
mmetsp:Transcript_15680/g.11409  ORF Transcript_15680/g.11409 Transcript_15680/m.11409 type:complete len:103 (-) Transcript_15680:1912-2220(-)